MTVPAAAHLARSRWLPTGMAVVLSALMLWLAGGPLDLSKAGALARLELLIPAAELDAFPGRYEWRPVAGAEIYEISVARVAGPDVFQGELVFRQRGATPTLTLTIDEGASPGPGWYVWEVVALRADRPVAAARRSFHVVASDAGR